MRALLLLIASTFIFSGCGAKTSAKSPEAITHYSLRLARDHCIYAAEKVQLKRGLHEQKVAKLLGRPSREEKYADYKVWFYVTKAIQGQPSAQNFTPLIFKNGYLIDWGYFNYNLLHDEQRKIESPKYADADKKLPQEHQIILPPVRKKKEPTTTSAEQPLTQTFSNQ